MVNLVGGSASALRFDQFDLGLLLDGEILSSGASSLTVQIEDGSTELFTGIGFQYDAMGIPAAGTITGIRETFDGSLSFEFTGLNLGVSQLLGWADAGQNAEALQTIFAGNDNITGTTFDDLLTGYARHDNLFGGEGADILNGGAGNDHLFGHSANGGADGSDTILGGDGNDYIQGNAGNDSLNGDGGSDRIQGGQGDDIISGGEPYGNDTINGNRGNDTIYGLSGDDFLRGGQGNDKLLGDDGSDTLSGDLGQDTLNGSFGIDTYLFTPGSSTLDAPDEITGFAVSAEGWGGDLLSLGFVPTALLRGSAGASLDAALLQAQNIFAANGSNGHAAVAIDVGQTPYGMDIYLFYSDTGNGGINAAIHMTYFESQFLQLSQFI